MHEIVTVTKIGKGNGYYEVASTQRNNSDSGSLGAFSKELEALQYASRHVQQHRAAPHNAVLSLTEEQQYLLDHGAVPTVETKSSKPQSVGSSAATESGEEPEAVDISQALASAYTSSAPSR
jgi:uncharacterized iron-regulated membrane protein